MVSFQEPNADYMYTVYTNTITRLYKPRWFSTASPQMCICNQNKNKFNKIHYFDK